MSVDSSPWIPSPRIREILACPRCRAPLAGQDELRCPRCEVAFPRDPRGGALDLRPHEPYGVNLEVEVGLPLPDPEARALAPLRSCSEPQVDFKRVAVPRHLSSELLSYFPAAAPGQRALDLGCGSSVHRTVCEHAGFDYVGLDYANPAADVLGDAHALPFLDGSFDFVLSIAVFEHLRLPVLAAREVRRVLTDGGCFLGTVAFLEPFHHNSIFHHTHLGIWSVLQDAGLAVQWVAPSRGWNVLRAQATNALFPGIGGPLANLAIAPAQALHRLLWRLSRLRHPRLSDALRLRRTTGSFAFLAHPA